MQSDQMKFDINRPWLTLDPWQNEFIEHSPKGNNFLLCGRQVGKTTAMSIAAVEDCIKHFKQGEFVLINSITEKQGYHVLAKALAYAQEKYPTYIKKGKDKPTMHKIMFKNGTGILSYAAGETGEGLRGYTIKKLMVDEGSRMTEEYYIAVLPMLSVVGGSIDIASTPAGKKHKDGSEKFFFKCSKDHKYKKFYVNAEDCPRHDKEFLKNQKEILSELMYAQEYLAVFTDELRRLFDDALIEKYCILKKSDAQHRSTASKWYLGVDVAGFGKDESAHSVLEKLPNKEILQRDLIIERGKFTTQTTNKIFQLNQIYPINKIGVDDGGLGFGVFSELMSDIRTKRKTEALNNAARAVNRDETKHKRLLKEEMYLNLLSLLEHGRIKLLDDDDLKASLASVCYEDEKIYASYNHPVESLIRAAWLASQGKDLNIFIHSF